MAAAAVCILPHPRMPGPRLRHPLCLPENCTNSVSAAPSNASYAIVRRSAWLTRMCPSRNFPSLKLAVARRRIQGMSMPCFTASWLYGD